MRKTMHHAETQAAALTDFVGHKERLEDMLEHIRRHSRSAIGYPERHVIAWRALPTFRPCGAFSGGVDD